MSGNRILFVQAPSANATQANPAQTQTAPTASEIREQIRQSLREVRHAAQEARHGNGVTVIDGRPVVFDQPSPPPQPGVTIHPASMEDVIPPQAVNISIAFFILVAVIIIGWPIARALGRRLERRGEIPVGIDPALAGQLQRIEQAVDAMSIEIERISESQRFMAKLQSGASAERSALGATERR
jgi:hypothetical protein